MQITNDCCFSTQAIVKGSRLGDILSTEPNFWSNLGKLGKQNLELVVPQGN